MHTGGLPSWGLAIRIAKARALLKAPLATKTVCLLDCWENVGGERVSIVLVKTIHGEGLVRN